ncbi:MAG: hypothetical protein JWR51_4629 [Devosia sp.]|uniref:hypothetical protein n=1 Tax=Devosia sp. TaxID=1871048 RepID=UPI00262F31B3|nr:hypothetical protein [Devosia sp.]MDB5531526.1 hypothetical protein [Devosia sp.]
MGETVTAVASMTSHGILGEDVNVNARIIDAMVEAVKKAQAAGITDPEAIRHAQIEARDKVLAS